MRDSALGVKSDDDYGSGAGLILYAEEIKNMELSGIIGLFTHLDKHLMAITQYCGGWTYLVLFGIIFAETGFVLTPFLPGDSLLFVVGAFSAQGAFQPFFMGGILLLAAIAGDSVNYAIGKYFGRRLTQAKHIQFFKKEYPGPVSAHSAHLRPFCGRGCAYGLSEIPDL